MIFTDECKQFDNTVSSKELGFYLFDQLILHLKLHLLSFAMLGTAISQSNSMHLQRDYIIAGALATI